MPFYAYRGSMNIRRYMRHSIEPKRDFTKLTPCAARLAELLCLKLPEISDYGRIKEIILKHDDAKQELDLFVKSPSHQLSLLVLTSRDGVEIRFQEPNKAGTATAVFSMHPLNFHRTCEAAVDFIEKVSKGQIIVARENKRTFPLIGPKRLRFFDVGEIVGAKASHIEKVYNWHGLHVDSFRKNVNI